MIYLHKLLPLLVSPLFVMLVLIVLSLWRRSLWPKLTLLVVFLISTNPFIGNWAVKQLENDYAYAPVSARASVDTVVVLSGMLKHTYVAGHGRVTEFYGPVDRLEAGLEFIREAKAQQIIFTRGKPLWNDVPPEGEILAEIAISRGVSKDQIQLTPVVINTDQEARAVKEMLNSDAPVVLVTSAFHMKRAVQVFKAHGVNVIPHPVDYQQGSKLFFWADFLPQADALDKTSLFVREMIGRAYYGLRY